MNPTPLVMPKHRPVLTVQCPNPTKAAYASEEAAQAALTRIQNLPDDVRSEIYPVRVYRCQFTGGAPHWHLTHRATEKGESQ